MATEGVEGIYLETHNWGRSAKFLQNLGFEIEFSTEDGSGMLRNGQGPYVILSEVPNDRQPQTEAILKVVSADAFGTTDNFDVVKPFDTTHYGTLEMKVRDPDGRIWSIQAPA